MLRCNGYITGQTELRTLLRQRIEAMTGRVPPKVL